MDFDGGKSDEDHGDTRRHSSSSFDDSDEDNCTELEIPERPRRHHEVDDFSYTVLAPDQIMRQQRRTIDDVNNVLSLSPQITRMILNHFKWDKEVLFEAYFERSSEEFFRNLHVLNPFRSELSLCASVASTISQDAKRKAEVLCGICFCMSSDLRGLGCGHSFCTDCWKCYLATKTCTEGVAQNITCPAHNCDILVDDVTFVQLADDAVVIEKYHQLITNTFVDCSALLRWCPAPDCTMAVMVNSAEPRAVRCKCGHQFCFMCGENWHEPASCNWLKKWIRKCADDSETSNWIAAHTKECPKCNVTIEKDGGCNHMVCKNPACRHDFCWVCLGSWEPHGSSWYSCNRFDEEEARAARFAQELYRASMAKYLHYYNRYMNHMQSMKMEHKLYASVQLKMDTMQEEMSWIEVQFLKEAVDILCECRQTLMYSYVFAYYLRQNNQKIIFEDNQRDLESATEKISECLEREITVQNLYDIKQKVLDLSHYCQKRRSVLLNHVHEGYDKDWWDFVENA